MSLTDSAELSRAAKGISTTLPIARLIAERDRFMCTRANCMSPVSVALIAMST